MDFAEFADQFRARTEQRVAEFEAALARIQATAGKEATAEKEAETREEEREAKRRQARPTGRSVQSILRRS